MTPRHDALPRSTPAALRWLPWSLPAALVALAVGVVLAAPPPAPLEVRGPQRYGLDAVRRETVFWTIAREQPMWRIRASAHFPDHPWSSEDDYHWNVCSHVQAVVAPQAHVPPSAIWALYDEGVRTQWQVRPPAGSGAPRPDEVTAPLRPTVVPLHPRTK